MTKTKAALVGSTLLGVAILEAVMSSVSAQNAPANSVQSLTAQLKAKTEQAINARQTAPGRDGVQFFTGDAARDLASLHSQAAEVQEASMARPAADRAAAIAKIRAFSGNPGLNPEYVSTSRSSYNHQVNAEFYRVGPDYYEIDLRTNEIIQFGPAPMRPGETGKNYRVDAQFTPEQLSVKAREFIAQNAPGVDLTKLTPTVGEKSGTNYFFRWTDQSRTIDGTQPFIQVGLTVGGDLLSYTNSLGL